ncbi:MAG: hypothetical protein HFJ40_07450 [Clostridia bacterium]|nr:hypothetical protein [Clostridia bacterium]
MQIDELWDKMQAEFTDVKEKVSKIDTIEEKVNEIDAIKEKVSKIDAIEEKVNEIDAIKEKVNQIDDIKEKVNEIDVIKEKVNEIDDIKTEIKKINDKLDIMTNVNMAQILREQTRTRKEINYKIDQFMLQNNVEHKQFAYQIAKLEKENGITRIG